MSEVTNNLILDAITKHLGTIYPNYDVFVNQIKEGLKPPCFFVKVFPVEQTKELGNRYTRTLSIAIRFFDADEDYKVYNDVADQLYEHLELVPYGSNFIHGTSMNYDIIDDVLHFFVDYAVRIRKEVADVPPMQDLDVEEGLKE